MELSASQATKLIENCHVRSKIISCHDPDYILIDAKRDPALIPVFFIYQDKDGFFYHGFHKARIPDTEFFDIQSPYGYGGPLIESNDKNFVSRAWKEYHAFCVEQKIIAEFIRFHPLLDNWKNYPGEVVINRPTVSVDLLTDDLIPSYKENRVRTAVRKGIKNNIQVRLVDPPEFLPIFNKLYRDSMLRLNTNEFYLFNHQYIKSICSWNCSFLTAAFHGDAVIAVLISLIKNHVMELHLFGSTEEGNSLRATNLIYHETFLLAKKMGCRVAHFGGGTSDDPNDPLLYFKLGYSNNISHFRIGKYVHNHDVYSELRNQWVNRTGEVPKRVLFYR